ncbi:MAG: GreA/GreB family elongation factor [Candidatus Pacebacteria bacterium]|nr:GreA/GreB family elongation factor [Candidatus Paceibacterota bacterium]
MEEKKFYLTREGLERTKKELRGLKELKLAKTRGESPKILQSEDLNPEYIVFQEDISFLEARIVEIENILKNYELIKAPAKSNRDIIDLGATVVVEVDRQADEFTLVGSLEADPNLGRISNESPVGKALMGHRVGDEISVTSPIKTIYKIRGIKYKCA